MFSDSYSSIALSGEVINTPPRSNITALGVDIDDCLSMESDSLRCTALTTHGKDRRDGMSSEIHPIENQKDHSKAT